MVRESSLSEIRHGASLCAPDAPEPPRGDGGRRPRPDKGPGGGVVSLSAYLRLCQLATWGEWIFTHAPLSGATLCLCAEFDRLDPPS